jgi:chemotaxis response regulator CheB
MSIAVLIVDDQALIRGGLRKIVDSEPDMRVVGEAEDGLGAVEAATRTRPDVAVMDIRCRTSTGSRPRAGSSRTRETACEC